MTVLLPGMTEDDQRVKINSSDSHGQGLLDSWKSKASIPIPASLAQDFIKLTSCHTYGADREHDESSLLHFTSFANIVHVGREGLNETSIIINFISKAKLQI